MFRSIDHVGLTVRNLMKSIAFYRDVLGGKVAYTRLTQDGWDVEGVSRAVGVPGAVLKSARVLIGDNTLELIEYDPPGLPYSASNGDVGIRHVSFEVGDIREAYDSLQGQGVRFNTPPFEITQDGPQKGFKFCYFFDPDGIQLEIFQRPPRS